MSDALKKVQSGQKLHIPAKAYNAFIDAAVDLRQRSQSIQQQSSAEQRNPGIILVRNDSGSDQERLAVLGIGTPIISPGANLNEFKNRIVLSCQIPVAGFDEGKFVILAEPLAAGRIGRAYVASACPVKIDVPHEHDEWRYADIDDGVTANLKVNTQGSAGILWREGGVGVQWAVVRLSNDSSSSGPTGPTGPTGVTTADDIWIEVDDGSINHIGPYTNDPDKSSHAVVVDLETEWGLSMPCRTRIYFHDHTWDSKGHTLGYFNPTDRWADTYPWT